MSRSARTLRLRIRLLSDELATCRTADERRCISEALADAERQLSELEPWTELRRLDELDERAAYLGGRLG